ncbi:MAG: flavodoxin family protein [Bacteroidaceae bacterium]|nr:flavodoxin family protein [Bacteroidaceae bacterium]
MEIKNTVEELPLAYISEYKVTPEECERVVREINKTAKMRILVLLGSPHANGNTAALVDAFNRGATEAGHEVNVVNVAKKHINGCLACGYCRGKGEGQCIQDDGMQEVYPLLRKAQIIVFASPIYYFTMSGQIQSAISRIYSMQKPPLVQQLAMLLSSYSPNVYDAAKAQLRDMANYFGAKVAGVVTADNSENLTEAKLQEAYNFGRNL